jgi:hypothetical protein
MWTFDSFYSQGMESPSNPGRFNPVQRQRRPAQGGDLLPDVIDLGRLENVSIIFSRRILHQDKHPCHT